MTKRIKKKYVRPVWKRRKGKERKLPTDPEKKRKEWVCG